jgi:Zn-dependent alcohol dehydrogenases
MALNATMRGVLYSGIPYQVTVANLPMPTIQNQTDVIVHITTAAICGSDLHMYHGMIGGTPPWGMGHEAVGYISEVGSAVSSLSVGDYVVIPDNLAIPHVVGPSGSADVYSFGIGLGLGGLQGE